MMCLGAVPAAAAAATTTSTTSHSSTAMDIYNHVPRGGSNSGVHDGGVVAGGGGGDLGMITEWWYNWCSMMDGRSKKTGVVVIVLSVMVLLFVWLYVTNYGFRRSVHFWKVAGPLALEYKMIVWKLKYLDGIDIKDMNDNVLREKLVILSDFHKRTAPKAMQLALDLGGIYIKIGQVMSTVGSGILDPNYVEALQPLQNGIPPRSYAQIANIIESSTGKTMEEMFVSFSPTPVGSASVAQAHIATLRPSNEKVIVKVQYPEVAAMFHADLNNLETLRNIVLPDDDNKRLIQSIRKRHENELDFQMEADNLRLIRQNMQRHGVEPAYIRIPQVKNETGLCNRHVLVMEYLEGTHLSTIIQQEQIKYAKAILGNNFNPNNATELRATFHKYIRKYLEQGNDPNTVTHNDDDPTTTTNSTAANQQDKPDLLQKLMDQNSDDDSHSMFHIPGPLAANMFRLYANTKYAWSKLQSSVIHFLTGQSSSSTEGHRNVNVKRLLKTLIHVHGLQLLRDGYYNADPHPGNCILLPDGRLGLLDYGMVGKLSEQDRINLNTLVHTLAMAKNPKKRKHPASSYNDNEYYTKDRVAQLYREYGYQIHLRNDNLMDPTIGNTNAILHRIATFHFDSIDLSPIQLEDGKNLNSFRLLRNIQERYVPPWIEQGRRLTALLMGVAAQTARPISLAKEWDSIAMESLQEYYGRNKQLPAPPSIQSSRHNNHNFVEQSMPFAFYESYNKNGISTVMD